MFTYAFVVNKRSPIIVRITMNMLSWIIWEQQISLDHTTYSYRYLNSDTSIYIVPSQTENAIIFIVLPGINEKVNILPGDGGKHVNVSIHLIKDDRPWRSTQLNITQVELVISTSTAVSSVPKGLYGMAMVFCSCPIPKKRLSYCVIKLDKK